MKQCNLCKELKESDSFAAAKKAKDGLQNYCKVCQRIYRENLKAKPKQQLERLVCARCSCEKSIDNFPIVESSSTGYGSWCGECKINYRKEYDYDERYRDRRRERVQWFRSIKSGKPCADCGQVLEPECMDYDHVDDNKTDRVSGMVLHNSTMEVILKEIDKCDLVCLLCHNRRTQNRFGFSNRKYPPHVLRNIDIINKAKSKPCECCGKQYEWFNMQFDHVDSHAKAANISQLKSAKVSRLLAEISKCNVICALCHRKKSLSEQLDGYYPQARHKIYLIGKCFVDIDNHTKECSNCHDILSFDEFHAHKNSKLGLNSQCKNCLNKLKRDRRGSKKAFVDFDGRRKECTKCHETLSFDMFHKNNNGTKTGLTSWCKQCMDIAQRNRRKLKDSPAASSADV